MSGKLAIMAGLAVVFGTTSYYAGNEYLDNQTQARLDQLGSSQQAIDLASIVVATESMRFGEKLTEEKLKLVSWPADAMPEGAFTSIEDAMGNGERKAIKSIEANEPVLTVKLTGEDGRAGLAGIIADGMRAVTIPVDSVKGVGGFVMPGDRVDIVFTQRDRATGQNTAKIIMDKVKVLSVDQQAESRADAPMVAKTVTLETDTEGAKQLALASEIGRLSLLLRSAGDETSAAGGVISLGGQSINPGEEGGDDPQSNDQGGGFLSFLNGGERKQANTTIRVVRGDEVRESVVPVQEQIKKKKVQ